jgi:hypothetical protein
MLSHRIEREIEYLAKTTLPLNSIGIIHSLPVLRMILHLGIIFTHIYLFAIGENVKGLIFHSQVSVFWRFMPKGEKVLAQSKRTAPPRPKQKDRTTTNFKNVVFQIWVKKRFFNWNLIFDRIFKLV